MTYRNPDPSKRPPAEPWKLCFIVQCTASEADAKRAEIEALTGARMVWWSRADAVSSAIIQTEKGKS